MRCLGVSFGAAVSLLPMTVVVAVGCASSSGGGAGSGGATASGGGGATASGAGGATASGAGGATASGGGGSDSGVGGQVGGGGSNAGRGGAAGGPVTGTEGIVATIGTEVTEYRQDPFAYAGRPPLLEIWAQSDTAGTFRIVVGPTAGTTIVSSGTYACHPGFTYLTLMRANQQYDTYTKSGGSCTVTVTDAGPGAGARFAGTFSGTLINAEGDAIEVSEGSFLGVLTL